MDNLQNGIAAFKAGKREEARKFFIAAVHENPNDANAWGWLYQVADNDQERLDCLDRILKIDPQNIKASQLRAGLVPPQQPVQSHIKNGIPRQSQGSSSQRQKTENRSNVSTVRLVLVALISVFLVLCCLIALANTFSSSDFQLPSSIGQLPSSGNNIKYVVSGSASSASITYMNETGGMEQRTLRLPFKLEMNVGAGAPLSIVAQMEGSGSITCEIWVNGQKTKSSTSTADYGLVTCADWTIR